MIPEIVRQKIIIQFSECALDTTPRNGILPLVTIVQLVTTVKGKGGGAYE